MKTIIIAAAALFVGGGFVYLSGARKPSAPTLTLSEQCSVAMAKSEENPIMRQMMDNELSNEELLALDKTQLENLSALQMKLRLCVRERISNACLMRQTNRRRRL